MAEIVRVEGLADLKITLQNLPIHLRKKVMYRLLKKAAAPILLAAKANAPVARKATRRVIPGLIRDTLKIAISKFKKSANGEFGVFIKPIAPGKIKRASRSARRGGVRGPNFGDPFYYRFQEFGFQAVGRIKAVGGKSARVARKASGGARFVPGKEFLGRAFESTKSAALNLIRSDLAKEIAEKLNSKGR